MRQTERRPPFPRHTPGMAGALHVPSRCIIMISSNIGTRNNIAEVAWCCSVGATNGAPDVQQRIVGLLYMHRVTKANTCMTRQASMNCAGQHVGSLEATANISQHTMSNMTTSQRRLKIPTITYAHCIRMSGRQQRIEVHEERQYKAGASLRGACLRKGRWREEAWYRPMLGASPVAAPCLHAHVACAAMHLA
eukprot:364796-Chlamydomonas_euryale.AAC.8